MPRTLVVAIVAVPLILLGGPAMCQNAQNPRRSPVGVVHLMSPVIALESESVRNELMLTNNQRDQINVVMNRVSAARDSIGLNLRLDPEVRKARFAEFQKIATQGNADLEAVLADNQRRRLKQIVIWIPRGEALFTQEIISELKLTDDQKMALTETFEELKKRMSTIVAADLTDESIRKATEQGNALRREFDEQYLKVLTDEQRKHFDELRGPKFEVEMSEFPTIYGRGPGKRP